jgi:hypothetical protein
MAAVMVSEGRLSSTIYSDGDMIESFEWMASTIINQARDRYPHRSLEDALIRDLEPSRYEGMLSNQFEAAETFGTTGYYVGFQSAGFATAQFFTAEAVAANHYYGLSGDVTGGANNWRTTGTGLHSASYQYVGSRGGNDFYIDLSMGYHP